MKLAEYMDKNGLTDAELAAILGKDRTTVSRYRRGDITPSVEVIKAIHAATRRAVGFEDWFTK